MTIHATETTTETPHLPPTAAETNTERHADQTDQTEATNATIARTVAERYKDKLCYVRSTEKAQAIDRAAGWFVYRKGQGNDADGGVWTREGAEKAIVTAIDDTIRAMLADATKSERRDRMRDLLNALNRLPAIKQVATYYMDKPLRAFNTDPYLLNVKNGTLNLRALAPDADPRDQLFRPAEANDLCSKQATAAYDPKATCPGWRTFLHQAFAGDIEVIAFVQRALGYTLLGVNPEHAAFICYGGGGNGKGVLTDSVAHALGNYAGDLSPDVLVGDFVRSGSSLQPELTCHRDVRLIVSSEPKRGVLNGHRFKSWTGDTHIQLRMLYGEADSMPVTFTFWLATNVLPDLNEQTDAVERRAHIIPFTVSFKSHPNLNLRVELAEEADGILTWLVEGLADWYRRRAESRAAGQGDSGLCPPEVIVQASRDWLTSESLFTRLFDELLVRGDHNDRLLLADLNDALTHFVADHEEDFPHAIVNHKLVNEFLKTFGLAKRTVGGQVYVYGVRFEREQAEKKTAATATAATPLTHRESAYLAVCAFGYRAAKVSQIAEVSGVPQRSLYVTLGRMAEEGLVRKRGTRYEPVGDWIPRNRRLDAPLVDALADDDEALNHYSFVNTLLCKMLYQDAMEQGGTSVRIDGFDAWHDLGKRLALRPDDMRALIEGNFQRRTPGFVKLPSPQPNHADEIAFDPAAAVQAVKQPRGNRGEPGRGGGAPC